MALLPGVDRDPVFEAAGKAFAARLDRQMLLVVGHRNPEQARAAAMDLSDGLRALDGVTRVEGRVSESRMNAWRRLYGPYRHQLPIPRLRVLLERKEGGVWAREALARVYNPFAAVGSGELKKDPFFLLRSHLLHVAAASSKFQIEDGWRVQRDPDGTTQVLITAELSLDPFGMEAALNFEAAFEGLLSHLRADHPNVTLNRLGTVFYAAAGIRSGKSELSTIGIGSLLGVMALVIVVFHSPIPLALVLLTIACGLAVALAVTQFFLGPVHLFTLVFGTSLVGVSVDYAFHFLSEHRSGEGSDPQSDFPSGVIWKILPALLMSLATSILAYMALFVAPFPGLRQIALFSVVGLLTAFAVVFLWFPLLMRRRDRHPVPGRAMIARWVVWIDRLIALRWALPAVLTVLMVIILTGLRIDDDVRQMQTRPAALLKEERFLNGLMGRAGDSSILMIHGTTAEKMLRRLEAVSLRLERMRGDGDLDGYTSVDRVLPSRRRQEVNHQEVREKLYRPWFPLLRQKLGLDDEVGTELLRRPFEALDPETWTASPASLGWRSLWLDLPPHGVFSAVLLNGVKNKAALTILMKDLEGVARLSTAETVSTIFRQYRDRIQWLVLGAYGLIFLLLWIRYGIRGAFRLMVPPFSGALAGLALLAAAGLPLNLMSLFALVLVLGLGIDYALFMGETRGEAEATLLAVAMSALTTLFSFGLLSFSATHAIANFGLVAFGGITASFLLAPMTRGIAKKTGKGAS